MHGGFFIDFYFSVMTAKVKIEGIQEKEKCPFCQHKIIAKPVTP